MKKHQKVLLGIMALSLAGGTGTAIALNFTGANSESVSNGTDEAIYLYWGTDTQKTNVSAEVKNLEANVPQYRGLVVSPKSSNALTGYVKLEFKLELTDNQNKASSDGKSYALPGLTVNVYEVTDYEFNGSSYTGESKTEDNTFQGALKASGGSELSFEFFVEAKNQDDTHISNYKETTKYYTLEFKWDGTDIESNQIFGGTLNIKQTFSKEKTING